MKLRPIAIAFCASLGLAATACADNGYYGAGYSAGPGYYASADDNPFYGNAYWAYNDGGWYTGPTFEGEYTYVEPGHVPDYVSRHRENHHWNRSVHHADRVARANDNRGFNNRFDPSTTRGQEAIGGTGQDQRG